MNPPSKRRVALFLSVDSFEGFYGGTFGLTREQFLATYRNDFVWEYSEGLRRNGHTMFVYILSYGQPELREITPGFSVRFIPLPPWLRVVDSVLYRLRNTPGFRGQRERVAYQVYRKALKRALRDDGIDVLYHQEIWTPRFDIVVNDSAVPVIGAEHGAVFEPWMEPAKRQSLPRAAGITCQSKEAIDKVTRFGGRAEMFYNAVDTDFFSPGDPATRDPSAILAVGRLVEPQKRLRDLLHAIALAPEARLLLVGSGPDEAMLKELADSLQIRDRVQFLGFISDRDKLRSLYRECGVFVSTSAWEAVALVILEAMSCETPIICTRIPSFEDLIVDRQNGLLVPVGRPDEVAKAFREAKEHASELGSQARSTILARHSARGAYERLSSFIERV